MDIDAASVPLIEGALELAPGNVPGGGRTNRQHFSPHVSAPGTLDPAVLDLLYDPQTSGGLLFAVSPVHADAAAAILEQAGVPAARIGRATARSASRILIR
jgi:selenide, water dikinase